MHITRARMTIPLLGVVIGLFFGCSTFSSSKKSSSEPNNLSRQELETALKNINQSLSEEGNNADLHYRKGYILSEIAGKQEKISRRSSIYQHMRQSLEEAEQLYESSQMPEGRQKVDELLKVRWSSEHNQGVQIIQTDSSLSDNDFDRAAAHFNNATIILPDSAISYKQEAQSYYRNRQPEKAITTLETARKRIERLPSEILEQLAFLYLETDQHEKAVSIYEEAESFSDQNLNLIHGLANAYITAGEHQKAIELLNMLVRNEPHNIIYAQTRGMELYFLGTEKLDALLTGAKDNQLNEELLSEADSLLEKATIQLKKALKINPDNTEVEQSLAYFYQNNASKYQQLLPYLSGQNKKEVSNTIQKYLRASIPFFKSLAQKNPDKNTFWNSLYQVYSYLGMESQAREAKSKMNL